jgi:hypothetical protein
MYAESSDWHNAWHIDVLHMICLALLISLNTIVFQLHVCNQSLSGHDPLSLCVLSTLNFLSVQLVVLKY